MPLENTFIIYDVYSVAIREVIKLIEWSHRSNIRIGQLVGSFDGGEPTFSLTSRFDFPTSPSTIGFCYFVE